MTTLLITGATRGLGLATARAARSRGAHVLVAGRSAEAVGAVAREVEGEPVVVDLERLADVRAVVADLPRIDVLALNAGLQVVTGATRTPDGFETTFQVNHLSQLLLLDLLLARADGPGRVVLTGSGTHDDERRTGMPAPLDGTVRDFATAHEDGRDPAVAGRARYTTSKLLNAATVLGVARERPDVHVACFDPGLMLDTGLSRQYPPVARRGAAALAPLVRRIAPAFASTAKASSGVLAGLLLDDPARHASGAYVDHRGRLVQPSARARDEAFQAGVLRDSRALLEESAAI